MSHGERNRKMCHLTGVNPAPLMEQIAESHGPQCRILYVIIIQFNVYKQSLTKQVPFNCFSPFTPRVPTAPDDKKLVQFRYLPDPHFEFVS
jgi:hypothetical protein